MASPKTQELRKKILCQSGHFYKIHPYLFGSFMSCTKKNPLFSCCHLSTCVWMTFTLLKQLFGYEITQQQQSDGFLKSLSCPVYHQRVTCQKPLKH